MSFSFLVLYDNNKNEACLAKAACSQLLPCDINVLGLPIDSTVPGTPP
jgi:hypothetical protein